MSDQGAIPDRRDFGLIETLLWTPAGFHLLPEHLERLRASSRSLGFPYDEAVVVAALDAAVRDCGTDGEPSPPRSGRLRVRLVLSPLGVLETSATPIQPTASGTVWKAAIARSRFSSADPLLRHKTTRREIYENELAQAQAREGADEVLFLNERDEVCEGARCNVFLERDGGLLTPPLSSGLLPGTLRAHLLASGRAKESVLRLTDFAEGAKFYMGNSVRGLVRAKLTD